MCVRAHRAVEDHAVSVAQALDVCCQVEADGSVADCVHGLSVEEIMRSSWKQKISLSVTDKSMCIIMSECV